MNYTEALNYLDHMKRDLELDLQRLEQYKKLWDYVEVHNLATDLRFALSNFQDTLMNLRDRKGDNASTEIQDNIR